MVSTALGHFQRQKLTPEVVWRRIYSNTVIWKLAMRPVSQNTFAASCPQSCRWVVCVCPLPGAGCRGTVPSCLCHVLHPPSLESQKLQGEGESDPKCALCGRKLVIPVTPFFSPVPGDPPCNSISFSAALGTNSHLSSRYAVI